MDQLAQGQKRPKQPSSKPSNSSKASKSGWWPSIDFNQSLTGVNELVLFKNESKGELDKNHVKELVETYSKMNNEKTIGDITSQLNQLGKNERHLLRQEFDRRVTRIEEQLRSGASEKRIIEAHAQGANENMKRVVTGAGCAILVGLLVVAAMSYASKDSSRRTAAETDDGDDSDDDWRDAAKGSADEQLEFAMAKLREMKI